MLTILGSLVVILGLAAMHLRRSHERSANDDPALQPGWKHPASASKTARTGHKQAIGAYDYAKARAGYLKAQRHSETGKPLPKPKRVKRANVVHIDRRRAQ